MINYNILGCESYTCLGGFFVRSSFLFIFVMQYLSRRRIIHRNLACLVVSKIISIFYIPYHNSSSTIFTFFFLKHLLLFLFFYFIFVLVLACFMVLFFRTILLSTRVCINFFRWYRRGNRLCLLACYPASHLL